MLARLVRRKVATELAAEFHTLCAGVPGSYAVVPSAPPASAAAAAGGGLSRQQSQLVGDGTHGGRGAAAAAAAKAGGGGAAAGVALEPSIGSVGPGGSRRLPPLASANLLAAFTDAGCKPAAGGGGGGDKSIGVRPGVHVVSPGDKSIGARPPVVPAGDRSIGVVRPGQQGDKSIGLRPLLQGAAAAAAANGASGRVIPLDGSGACGQQRRPGLHVFGRIRVWRDGTLDETEWTCILPTCYTKQSLFARTLAALLPHRLCRTTPLLCRPAGRGGPRHQRHSGAVADAGAEV